MSKLFWLFVKWRIKKQYGICTIDGRKEGLEFGCICCKAGEVMDFIDKHITLL